MDVESLDIISGDGGGGSGGGGGGSGSRWNPTKEQIDMLEGLYRQGLRTPSADQINHITNRLRVFGHIEGKNVFYWFQNHKARLRQKLKQDNINSYSRLLHKTSSVFPPPACPNVVCSPFYIPYHHHPADHHHHHHHLGRMYQQQQQQQQPNNNKVLLPRPPLKRKSNSLTATEQIMVEEPHKICNNNNNNGTNAALNHQELDFLEYSRNLDDQGGGFINNNIINGDDDDHQTLDLFPLKPSGNLQSKTSASTKTSFQNDDSAAAAAAAAAAGTNPLTSSGSATSTSDQQQRLF